MFYENVLRECFAKIFFYKNAIETVPIPIEYFWSNYLSLMPYHVTNPSSVQKYATNHANNREAFQQYHV